MNETVTKPALTMLPGVVPAPPRGLIAETYKEYDARPGVRAGHLEKIRKTPAYLQWSLANPEESSDAQQLGKAFHTLVLKDEAFEDVYAVWPAGKRRFGADWEAFKVEHAGKELIRQEELDKAQALADAVLTDAFCSELLARSITERTIVWKDGALDCKARLDIVTSDYFIYDLKSTRDATDDSFGSDAYKLGYLRKAAFYMDGFRKATGKVPAGFGFLAAESEESNEIAVYHVLPDDLALGRAEYRDALEQYRRCNDAGIWPSYPKSPMALKVPRWVRP